MCTSPVLVHYKPNPYNTFETARFKSEVSRYVPCGHCEECLSKRKNSMAARIYQMARKFGEVYFLTFTYNNDSLPLALTYCSLNEDTGSFDPVCPPLVLDLKSDDSLRRQFLPFVLQMKASRVPRYCYFNDVSAELVEKIVFPSVYGFSDSVFTVTPSVSKRDFRLWLKNARVRYKREFGTELDFKYICVPEYGGKKQRPHYHMLTFGLSRSQVLFLSEDWSTTDKRGFSYVEKCNAINPDGSDGYAKLGRYLGKYISKGSYDNSAVRFGFGEKPRFLNSKNFGDVRERLNISFYHCEDLFGKLSFRAPSAFCPSGTSSFFSRKLGRWLTDSEMVFLFTIMDNRLKMHLGEYTSSTGETKSIQIRLPKYYIDKIFARYVKTYSKKDGCFVYRPFKTTSGTLCKVPLYYAYSAFKGDKFAEDYFRKLESYSSRAIDRPGYDWLSEFILDEESALSRRIAFARESRKVSYNKAPKDFQ